MNVQFSIRFWCAICSAWMQFCFIIRIILQWRYALQMIYLMLDGRKYIVCDPTYIGVSIGNAMPQFKQPAAKVVIINQNNNKRARKINVLSLLFWKCYEKICKESIKVSVKGKENTQIYILGCRSGCLPCNGLTINLVCGA